MASTSLYTALTGLTNNGVAINTIGNNLANMNTTAFKSSTADFAELLGGSLGTSATGDPMTVGLGSSLTGIERNCSQGTFNSTGVSTDAAINGNGYFVVSTNGGTGYTRSGQFEFNADGNLVSSDGFQLMGYMADDGTIDSTGALTPIQINEGQLLPATATTNLSMTANLDASQADNYSYSSSVQIYDSLGEAHTVTVDFTMTGPGAWSWTATIPAQDTGGAASAAPVSIGSGNLEFTNGVLTSPASNPTLSISGLSDGAPDMTVNFNLLSATGSPTITNYASASAVSSTSQDGYAASTLAGISIDSTGTINGLTASGTSIPLAQLALADFPNEQGLQSYQGSTFVATPSSGDPSIGAAGTGGRGSIEGDGLEESNVDMATEFVNLIVAQRAYEANSKVITTSDQLDQDTLNLIQ